MKMICKINFILIFLLYNKVKAQEMTFQEQNYVIEVNESKTSYLFINGIENPTLDIGSKSCIGEMQELKKGYWLIKLKAIKVFVKTSLLIISENGQEVPMIELKYNKDAATGKYTMDLTKKTNNEVRETVIESSTKISKKDDANNNETNESLEQRSINAINRSKMVLEEIDREANKVNIDNNSKKEGNVSEKVSTKTRSETEEYPIKYMMKPTFIAGKSNSTYSFLCSNLLQEGNELVFVFEFQNKLSTDLNISETVILIKKNIKGRKSSEIINGARISKNILKGKKEELIYVKCPYFQINESESVEIQFNEKTEYGMGRDISLVIDFKSFSKIKVLNR